MSNKLPELKPVRPETHGPLSNAIFNFEVPGETLVALHNALSFTMAHNEQYIKEGEDCQECFEAMYTMKKNLTLIIENAHVFQLFNDKNNKSKAN